MALDSNLRDGRLDEALAELQQQVRQAPADPKHRIFLFQLLAVRGDWDRALNQLDVLSEMDKSALAMVQTYREAIRCEALRSEVMAGKRSPLVFGEPSEWVAMLIEANRLTGEGRLAESQTLREQALEAAPATAGTVDDKPIEWVADGDTRLGPVIEALINGRYYWVPFQNVKTLNIEAPTDLRDLVWMPAFFTWHNGGETAALIPTRYPGSESSDDPQIRMARKTEWIDQGSEVYFGLGQRMLATDVGELPLMDVRLVSLPAAGDGPEASDAPAS